MRRPARSTLFPSPPLFRSSSGQGSVGRDRLPGGPVPAELARLPQPGPPPPFRFADHVGGGFAERLAVAVGNQDARVIQDRKSTRLNSSHSQISYAVFCLKK